MTWFMGRDVEFYFTTENSAYGISASGEDAASQIWIANDSLISDFIVGPLKTDSAWDGSETDVTASFPIRGTQITAIEGVDLKVGAEREDVDLLGRRIQDHIRLRDTFEITVIKKMADAEFAILYDDADAGLDSANAINPADDETEPESGFRVFLKIDNGTNYLWFTGRNCTYTDYTPGTPPVKSLTETLVFKSNLTNVGTSSYLTATTEAEL